jgi:hypothetical protein
MVEFHLQEGLLEVNNNLLKLLYNFDIGRTIYVQVMMRLGALKGVQEVRFYILSLVFHFFFNIYIYICVCVCVKVLCSVPFPLHL